MSMGGWCRRSLVQADYSLAHLSRFPGRPAVPMILRHVLEFPECVLTYGSVGAWAGSA